MNKKEIEEEIATMKKRISLLTNFLIEADMDYKNIRWDNGEGIDIIITAEDEDDGEIKHEVVFSFKDNGYFYIEVKKKQ